MTLDTKPKEDDKNKKHTRRLSGLFSSGVSKEKDDDEKKEKEKKEKEKKEKEAKKEQEKREKEEKKSKEEQDRKAKEEQEKLEREEREKAKRTEKKAQEFAAHLPDDVATLKKELAALQKTVIEVRTLLRSPILSLPSSCRFSYPCFSMFSRLSGCSPGRLTPSPSFVLPTCILALALFSLLLFSLQNHLFSPF